jgi:hypothetical protein
VEQAEKTLGGSLKDSLGTALAKNKMKSKVSWALAWA